jgi:ribose transport system permease protein
MTESKKKRFQIRLTGPMIICAGTLVFFSLFAKNFFTPSNAANIIRQASVLAIVAFGQTFAILIQGFDLSVGAVMGLTACLAAILMIKGIVPVIAAVVLALGVATFCGLVNGVVTNYVGLNPFVSTFGMWGMALGVALVISEEKVIFGLPDTLRFLHDGEWLGVPIPLVLVMVLWAILHFILKWTRYGTATYAIGGNPTAAELSGIPVRRYKTMIYAFSGLMAGIAGILFLARANAAQAVDTIGYEFDSIVAVVVGGTSLMGGKGGVTQTLLGVLLLAAVRNGLNMMGASIYLQLVVVGMILILAYIAENQTSSLGGGGIRDLFLKKGAFKPGGKESL